MNFVLDPEVAGGWGEATIADVTVHPPAVSKLEYRFEGWLGDDILESFPCYIVTERLYTGLQGSNLSGYSFDEVVVTTSEEFHEVQQLAHKPTILPKFKWLKVHGAVGEHDFALSKDYRLAVSEAGLALLQQYNIEHCDISELSDY